MILIGGTTWYLLSGSEGEQQVTVTSQINEPAADAQVALQKLGFNVQMQRVPDNAVPAERVISTIPGPDSRAAKGSTVVMQVSTGPKIERVPDVANRPEPEARDILTKAGFAVAKDPKREPSATVKSGAVISTNPAVGSNSPQNTPVVLTISTGPEQVRVPDVTGTQVSQATSNLEGAGFKVEVREIESSEKAGTVVGQNPSAGQNVDKGTTVTLQVAKAKQLVMPNVINQDVNAARAALIAAGFAPDNIKSQATAPAGFPWDRNKVWRTVPEPGSRMDSTANVLLEVRQ